MASINQQSAATPKQASRRRGQIDKRLDPEFFKAIGEPTRAKLLACLIKCGRPCSVTEVAECCSIDFSMVARHLAALSRAGVLNARKEGRTMWYQAQGTELAERFRSLADAIDEWDRGSCEGDCCDDC